MGKTVSIIIPTLNEEGTIEALIKSLKDDPCPHKEIIVVDGGSTDRTAEIADKAGARVLEESGNKSPANARNQGVEASSGEIVGFLDGDHSKVNDNYVGKSVEHFKDPNVAGVRCNARREIRSWLDKSLEHIRSLSLTKIITEEKKEGKANFTFIRKKIFDKVSGYPSLGFGEDKILYKKFGNYLKKNPQFKLKYSEESIAYRRHPSKVSEYFKQIRWYGRTIIPYLKKSGAGSFEWAIDIGGPLALLFSLISPLFVLLSPWFLIFFLLYLVRLVTIIHELWNNFDKYGLFIPVVDLTRGLGHLVGLLDYLFGRRHLSRE